MDSVKEYFKPQAKNIRQIFGDSDSYYRIPDYQRPYSWETEQIEELWDDIYTAMEINEDRYFLGATILIDSGKGYYDVIDGQQRLTTLLILFCVMRDMFLPNENVLVNSIKSLVDRKYRLHLITQSQYQNRFEQEILEKVKFPKGKLTKKEREKDAFINAVLIFKEKLELLKNSKNVKKFLNYLMERVVLITITASNQAFAVKLFRILNTRGLDLTNTDIIKSYLYGTCEKNKIHQLKATWNKIEIIADDVDEDLERLMRYYGLSVLETNPRTTLSDELINHKNFRSRKSKWELGSNLNI